MNVNNRNGKYVKSFWFDDDGLYRPATGEVFVLENEYHGDRDEDWIIRRTVGKRQESGTRICG